MQELGGMKSRPARSPSLQMAPHVGRQLSVNQSHTSYVLRGYLFWGVKLTYTINRQEGSLVAGAGAGSSSRDRAPEPRAGTKRAYSGYASLFKREIYHAPVGWYFSSYWLTERKSLPAALWARISATIGWGSGSYSHNTSPFCLSKRVLSLLRNYIQ